VKDLDRGDIGQKAPCSRGGEKTAIASKKRVGVFYGRIERWKREGEKTGSLGEGKSLENPSKMRPKGKRVEDWSEREKGP